MTRTRKTAAADAVTEPTEGSLDRDRIVQVALAMINQHGLANFSMRNLARELGVYPAAVYWYVPNRDRLLAEIVGVVLRGLSPEQPGLSWQDWLRALFDAYRDRIRQFPNVAPLIGSQITANAHPDLHLVENILERLAQAGFSGKSLVHAYNTVITGMVGFTTQEFAQHPPDGSADWRQALQDALDSVRKARFPRLAPVMRGFRNKAFILRWQNGVEQPMDQSFAMFSDVVIAGLEVLARRLNPEPAPPPG